MSPSQITFWIITGVLLPLGVYLIFSRSDRDWIWGPILTVIGIVTLTFAVRGLLREQAAPKLAGPTPSVTATAAYSMSDLRLSMLGGDVFIPHAPDLRTYTGIEIDAEVWNTGAPSAVVKWALMVIPEGKPPVSGQLTIIPKSLSLTGQYNNDVIYGADALDQKTRAKPVSTTPIVGKLLFYVHLEKSVVVAPSTRLELSATDIDERETTVSQVMGEWLQR
jgi:hypothetical protein